MSTATHDAVSRKVIETLASFGPAIEDVSPERTLEELDIDSLDLVELTQVVEETYGIDLEGSDFKNIATVGDVIDLVVAKVG